MIRLDYLQNPPCLKELSLKLIPDFAFASIANKNAFEYLESSRASLREWFSKPHITPFSFECGGFLEIFLQFKNIYYVPSLHYEIRRAIEQVGAYIATHKIPLSQLSRLDSIVDSALDKDSTLFIAPHINEDIFSINHIVPPKNATFALDVSYACALGLKIDCHADIIFLHALPLGLPNKLGMIASHKPYTSMMFWHGVSEAILQALRDRAQNSKQASTQNMELFHALKKLLGKDVDLFASEYAPNTLPLRFKHINTRHLIEHLYLEDIYIQPSQECALGFVKPSHVLLESGVGMLHARELCAITFDCLSDVSFVANALAQSYEMIRLMEF